MYSAVNCALNSSCHDTYGAKATVGILNIHKERDAYKNPRLNIKLTRSVLLRRSYQIVGIGSTTKGQIKYHG